MRLIRMGEKRWGYGTGEVLVYKNLCLLIALDPHQAGARLKAHGAGRAFEGGWPSTLNLVL
jgi:hypothetical protein